MFCALAAVHCRVWGAGNQASSKTVKIESAAGGGGRQPSFAASAAAAAPSVIGRRGDVTQASSVSRAAAR